MSTVVIFVMRSIFKINLNGRAIMQETTSAMIAAGGRYHCNYIQSLYPQANLNGVLRYLDADFIDL